MRRLRLLLIATLSVTPAALAHDADVLYARLETTPNGLTEIITLTSATLLQLAPVDADGDSMLTQQDLDRRADAIVAGVWNDLPLTAGGAACTRSNERALLEDGFISLSADWVCGEGDLRQDFKILRILPTNYRVVLGSQLEGERGRRFAQGVFTALEVPRPKPASVVDGQRLASGFVVGLRDTGVTEALALCFLAFLSAGTIKRGAARLALLIAGAAVVLASFTPPSLIVPVLLALGALGIAFVKAPFVAEAACLIAGVGLGLRSTLILRQEALGWLLGTAVVMIVCAAIGLPLGRIIGRRPRAWSSTRLLLVLLVLFSVGLRLGA